MTSGAPMREVWMARRTASGRDCAAAAVASATRRPARTTARLMCADDSIGAVVNPTREPGMKPAGFEIFDVADPAKPKSVVLFDASGPASRGVHHLWWVDGEYVHMASGAADFTPRNPRDDQCYRIVDVRQPTRPREVGRWWLPGTREGDAEPAPPRHPSFDPGYRAHNTNVYPRPPARAYVGYIDGGALVLDVADKAHPRLLGRWDYQPPFPGFCHTVVPLFDRNLLVVSDEPVRAAAKDWPN